MLDFITETYQWLFPDWITLVGVLTGASSVLFLALNKGKLGWTFGVINAGFFLVLMFQYRLYADVLLNAYYLITSGLGLFFWLRGGKKRKVTATGNLNQDGSGNLRFDQSTVAAPLKITRMDGWQANSDITRSWMFWVFAWVVGTGILGTALGAFTNAGWTVAYIDSFTTVGSLIAQWLLAKKIYENWYIWIAVDVIDIGLYMYKVLPAVAIMTVVYMIFCVIGLRKWRRDEKIEQNTGEAVVSNV